MAFARDVPTALEVALASPVALRESWARADRIPLSLESLTTNQAEHQARLWVWLGREKASTPRTLQVLSGPVFI